MVRERGYAGSEVKTVPDSQFGLLFNAWVNFVNSFVERDPSRIARLRYLYSRWILKDWVEEVGDEILKDSGLVSRNRVNVSKIRETPVSSDRISLETYTRKGRIVKNCEVTCTRKLPPTSDSKDDFLEYTIRANVRGGLIEEMDFIKSGTKENPGYTASIFLGEYQVDQVPLVLLSY